MKPRIWLVLSLFAVAVASLYALRVLLPSARYRDEIHNGIKAQMGDLYSPWVGARELLLHHRNPYGEEVTHQIQMVFYGHAISQNYAEPATAVINEQRFAYPVYTIFILAPTVYADFTHVRRWACFALGLLTAISVLLCLSLLRQRLPWETVAALLLFTLSTPQIIQGLRFQQLALLVGFLLIAAAWCASKYHLVTAGALLAISTIKPQMALLPLCGFAIWAFGDWPKRWRLAAGFITTLAVLFAAGQLLLPGWPGYFLAGIAAYRKYAPPTSPLRMVLGDALGELLGGIIVFALLLLAWRNRSAPADSRKFTEIVAGFLAGTILAFPLLTPYNQVLLILPVMLLLQEWKLLPRFSRILFAVIVSWPWIVSAVLLVFPPRLDSPSQLASLPSVLTLVFPLILPLLLLSRRGDTAALQLATADSHPS